MNDSDFRQLVADMRAAQKRVDELLPRYTYVTRESDSAGPLEAAWRAAREESLRLTRAVDQELGL